jgi:uncharacterized membrane protein YtjA (UPF0391 family)
MGLLGFAGLGPALAAGVAATVLFQLKVSSFQSQLRQVAFKLQEVAFVTR